MRFTFKTALVGAATIAVASAVSLPVVNEDQSSVAQVPCGKAFNYELTCPPTQCCDEKSG